MSKVNKLGIGMHGFSHLGAAIRASSLLALMEEALVFLGWALLPALTSKDSSGASKYRSPSASHKLQGKASSRLSLASSRYDALRGP